jgi:hypothetical protein
MSLEEKIKELEAKLLVYEQNGGAKLYYSLQRKMNEMADLMNATNLKHLDITDAKDKSFDRLKVIWQDAASIAQAVDSLGKIAKVTGDENADTERKPFVDTIADSRK